MRTLVTAALAALSIGVSALPAAAAMHGAELLPQTVVKLDTARATALAARPGKITDQELEAEAGGSGLRYSFDIVNSGKTYEVGVDAKTGTILENKAEGKHPDCTCLEPGVISAGFAFARARYDGNLPRARHRELL